MGGEAIITIDDQDKNYKVGDVTIIPVKAKHRIENKTNKSLVFNEVQWGASFEESDVVRIEDDYDRL